MLVFITSIRHPQNSNSYKRVCSLLSDTLESLCAQTCSDFRVVVVCNEPTGLPVREFVDYVIVDFPPPSDRRAPTTGMPAIRIDRGTKYAVGLIHARQYAPRHVMFFDADDYISKRVAAFVKEHPGAIGWYFDEGYRYRAGSSRLELVTDFYKLCGSSHVFHYSLFDLPGKLSARSSQDEIVSSLDLRYLNYTLGSHRSSRLLYKNKGIILQRFPFPAAVWVLGHGENHSGLRGKMGNIPLTEQLIDEFGFPTVNQNRQLTGFDR